MVKWQIALKKTGMSESELSQTIKKKIAQFRNLEKSLNEVNENLEDEELDESEAESLNDDAETLKEGMDELDEELVSRIQDYHLNKDKYAEKIRNMQEKVKQKASEPKPATPPEPVKTPVTVPTPTPVTTPNTPVQGADGRSQGKDDGSDGKEAKKKSGSSAWLLGGLLLVVSLGAYNYFQNKD